MSPAGPQDFSVAFGQRRTSGDPAVVAGASEAADGARDACPKRAGRRASERHESGLMV